MRVNVSYEGLRDLESDLRKIPVQAAKDIPKVLKEGVRTGGTLARDNAKRTAGKHGRLYPAAITWDREVALGTGTYSAEYGPDSSMPQGGMSFEYGSRNQPPHMDLNKSADVIGPSFAGEIRSKIGDWFWPES